MVKEIKKFLLDLKETTKNSKIVIFHSSTKLLGVLSEELKYELNDNLLFY